MTRKRIYYDLPVQPGNAWVQQFLLDLQEEGYEGRVYLWPQTNEASVWPAILQMTKAGELEEIGMRFSHANSWGLLPQRIKIGVALWEEDKIESLLEDFNSVQGILVSSRSGGKRLRDYGVTIPIEMISIAGVERIIAGINTSPILSKINLPNDILIWLCSIANEGQNIQIHLFADSGLSSDKARRIAKKVALDYKDDICISICLAVQSGQIRLEGNCVLLGKHHVTPAYEYITQVHLQEEDILLSLEDIIQQLPSVSRIRCYGLLRFEGGVEEVANKHNLEFSLHDTPYQDMDSTLSKVAIIGPYGVACGLAEESRILVENSPRPYTILAEIAEHEDILDNSGVIRCYKRDELGYGGLLSEIVRREVNVCHFEYTTGVFQRKQLLGLVSQLHTLGIKTIITNHSTNKDSVEIANEFDQVIVNNKEAYERSIELGMDRNKLSIIPLPARVLRDVSKEEIDKRMPNNPRIVTCGFAFKHKGIKELIYATQELLKSFPTLGLYLCCPEYPNWEESSQYLKECKELVDYLELHSSIFFIDKFLSMDELSPYLRGATVLAFPYSSSQNQDASGALRMAIAAERPIIVSTLGIFNELGDRVTRVEPENISDLIYALHSHLSNPQDRVRLDILDDIQASNISFLHWTGVYKAFNDVSIHLEGVFKSCTSFSQVLVNLALSFQDLGCKVSIDPWTIGSDPSVILPQKLHKVQKKVPQDADLTIRMTWPHSPEGLIGKTKAIIFPWECTEIPTGLGAELNSLDFILSTSPVGSMALEEAGVKKSKILTIPLGVDTDRFNPRCLAMDPKHLAKNWEYNRRDLDLDDLFIFLHLGCAMKRKGTDILLEEYCDLFSGDDRVLLVIKTYAQECDATPWITKCLREKRNAPRIIYVQENTPAVLIPGYYTMADCFILPFRGEGFALPVLEAMACALPTIVTDWGGPSQFINSDISILLGYNLVRAEGFHMPVPKEALWAEPSRGEIRAGMLWMVSHPEEAKAMALRARQVALKWTWKGAAYKILRETGVL